MYHIIRHHLKLLLLVLLMFRFCIVYNISTTTTTTTTTTLVAQALSASSSSSSSVAAAGLISRRSSLMKLTYSSITSAATSSSSSINTPSFSKKMSDNNNNNDSSSNDSPPPPPNIKWGIIGLGDVTQVKSGPPFYKCHGSDLVAVMRRTPGKAAEFAKGVPPENQCVGYDNLEDFFNHPAGMDAVYVSTRPGSHLEICRQVVNHTNKQLQQHDNNQRIKALYVEKPVGRCGEETREIVRLAQQGNMKLYTAYISRAYDRTQLVRKLLNDDKVIGDSITEVTYQLKGTGGARGLADTKEIPWRFNAKQSGGGLIMDVGCHVLDRIDYLCGGPLINVHGKAENRGNHYDVEDYVEIHATIGKADGRETTTTTTTPPQLVPSEGAKVSCTWDFSGATTDDDNTNDQKEIDELIIQGPKGSIKMVAMSPSAPVYVYNNDDQLVQTHDNFDVPQHTAQKLIQAVTDDLRGISHAADDYLSKGDNAIRTSDVIDKALVNYYGTRDIGFWDIDPTKWPGNHVRR